ncbi:MAG TPA: flagellar motor switch protein FliG [Acidobacteriota bacterium]|nr:flagellar motor switch protein FliG [Acidobacteriota bacterium]
MDVVQEVAPSESPVTLTGRHHVIRGQHLSGLRKAAILLVYLGEKVSAEIFKNLHDEEVKVLGQEIANLGWVDDDVSEYVLRECYQEIRAGKVKLRGELDYVRKVIESAFEPPVSQEILRFLTGKSLSTSESLKTLKYADPQDVFRIIKQEHPQTIAVVLSHLSADGAAEVLRLLPEETRADVAKRLAQLEQVARPVRNKILEVLGAKLRQVGSFEQRSLGGIRTVAEILNRMDRKLSRETLERIENDDPNLALSIRNLMFVFDDVLLLTDTDMRKIIQRVDKKVLVTALKGAAEELREHFFRNMSQRAVEMLKEDMEALGPVRLREVEAARQQVVAIVREMDAAGEIDIGGSGSEQYVV